MSSIVTYISADSLNQDLYSITESVSGVPYSTWIARWWNWTASIDKINHPRDVDTRSCNVSQIWDNVWFLPDRLSDELASPQTVRYCEIPHQKAIFLPVATGEIDSWSDPEFVNKTLNDEIRNKIISKTYDCDNHVIRRTAEIDGKKIIGFERDEPYRTNTSELFNISWKTNNIYSIDPGTGKAFAEGWFLFIKPLPPGDHVISYLYQILHPTNPDCNAYANIAWKIKSK